MSDETPELQGDEEILEGAEETSAEPEVAPESEVIEGEPAAAAAPEVDPDEKAFTDAIAANPKLQARFDAAQIFGKAGDHEKHAALLDEIAVELGIIEKPEPIAVVPPPVRVEPDEDDALTAKPERAVAADLAFRKSEFQVSTGLQSTIQARNNNINECDRLAREYQQAVEADGEASYGAKILKQNWNALNNTVQQQAQYIQNCEIDKQFIENVIKPNIAQIPWLASIKDLYLEATVKKMVDPFADPETQRQQLIRAGVKFPAAKAAAQPLDKTKMADQLAKVRKMGSLSKPKGGGGGAAPKFVSGQKAAVQTVPKLTASQLAEYRANGGRLIKAG